MPGQDFAQGSPRALQQQVHAPAVADARDGRLQGAEDAQAGNGQSLSKRLQCLAGFAGRIGFGTV